MTTDRSAHPRLRRLHTDLLRWFRVEGRDLPWRHTRDPYRILVSEVMLQQTQAARVVPAYRAFLSRFPTLAALAAAPTAVVLEQWRGLGYNRRALNLQRTARTVVDAHGGHMPATLEQLLALPGVGPYTARALLVFAFEQPAAAVDVNAARVIQRAVAAEAVDGATRQSLADALVAADPWLTAQALVELGARHCRIRRPSCCDCPIVSSCAWRLAGASEQDPAAAPRRSPQRFADSDRYHRGRLLDGLRDGPVTADALGVAARTDDAPRAQRLADALVSEGLAEWSLGTLRLPESQPEGPM